MVKELNMMGSRLNSLDLLVCLVPMAFASVFETKKVSISYEADPPLLPARRAVL